MAVDNFDVALAERDANLYTFRLGGRDWTVPPGDARNLASFKTMADDLIAQDLAAQINTMIQFLAAQLAVEDRDPFVDMIERVRPPLTMLAKIAERVAEQVTGRPLDSPPFSPGFSPPSSAPLKAPSSPADTPETPSFS